jgi:hypothetical protein
LLLVPVSGTGPPDPHGPGIGESECRHNTKHDPLLIFLSPQAMIFAEDEPLLDYLVLHMALLYNKMVGPASFGKPSG